MRLRRRRCFQPVPSGGPILQAAPLVEDLDREHLVELYAEYLTASTPYGAGYAKGRFMEYMAQNAIPAEAIHGIVRDAVVKAAHDPRPMAGTC